MYICMLNWRLTCFFFCFQPFGLRLYWAQCFPFSNRSFFHIFFRFQIGFAMKERSKRTHFWVSFQNVLRPKKTRSVPELHLHRRRTHDVPLEFKKAASSARCMLPVALGALAEHERRCAERRDPCKWSSASLPSVFFLWHRSVLNLHFSAKKCVLGGKNPAIFRNVFGNCTWIVEIGDI